MTQLHFGGSVEGTLAALLEIPEESRPASWQECVDYLESLQQQGQTGWTECPTPVLDKDGQPSCPGHSDKHCPGVDPAAKITITISRGQW